MIVAMDGSCTRQVETCRNTFASQPQAIGFCSGQAFARGSPRSNVTAMVPRQQELQRSPGKLRPPKSLQFSGPKQFMQHTLQHLASIKAHALQTQATRRQPIIRYATIGKNMLQQCASVSGVAWYIPPLQRLRAVRQSVLHLALMRGQQPYNHMINYDLSLSETRASCFRARTFKGREHMAACYSND